MDSLVWIVIIFIIGFVVGRVTDKTKKYSVHKKYSQNDSNQFRKYERPEPPVEQVKTSRWEGRDELFWGMMDDGVHIKGETYLNTKTENEYLLKLTEWFGQYCYINCQVSLGQLIKTPEQPDISEEERKRFSSICRQLAMDFVLVSKKTQQIICVIELDDATHQTNPHRVERDKKLNEIMAVAGIPLLHVSVQNMNEKPPVWSLRKENTGSK